jgi:hypothetical protein
MPAYVQHRDHPRAPPHALEVSSCQARKGRQARRQPHKETVPGKMSIATVDAGGHVAPVATPANLGATCHLEAARNSKKALYLLGKYHACHDR